jgi:hypothetical protein
MHGPWALALFLLPLIVLWAWLAAGVVALFVQLSIAAHRRVFVLLAACVAVVLFLSYVPGSADPPPRTPIPCSIAGEGVDFDIRDGLCYRDVPTKFQRR